jgi:hypothetical protein
VVGWEAVGWEALPGSIRTTAPHTGTMIRTRTTVSRRQACTVVGLQLASIGRHDDHGTAGAVSVIRYHLCLHAPLGQYLIASAVRRVSRSVSCPAELRSSCGIASQLSSVPRCTSLVSAFLLVTFSSSVLLQAVAHAKPPSTCPAKFTCAARNRASIGYVWCLCSSGPFH